MIEINLANNSRSFGKVMDIKLVSSLKSEIDNNYLVHHAPVQL